MMPKRIGLHVLLSPRRCFLRGKYAVDQPCRVVVEDGLDVRPSRDAQLLAGLLDRAQVFVHEQRVGGLDLRRLAVLVEVKRIAGPVDVGPALILAAAAHVEDRIVGAVEQTLRTEVLEGDAVGGRVQDGRRVEEQAGIIGKLRQRLHGRAVPCNSGPGGRAPATMCGYRRRISRTSRTLSGWPRRSAFGTCSVTQAWRSLTPPGCGAAGTRRCWPPDARRASRGSG